MSDLLPVVPCPYCERTYAHLRHVQNHIRLVHPEHFVSMRPRPVRKHKEHAECPHCGKGFNLRGNMLRHVRTVHQGLAITSNNLSVPAQINHVVVEQEFVVTEMLVLRRANGKLYLAEEIK